MFASKHQIQSGFHYTCWIMTMRVSSGGFRGGMGGMNPPHQPKTKDFGRKISLHFEKSVSISGCIPPHQPKHNDFGRKISLNFNEDLFLFFYFYFGDHLILGGKYVWTSDFGRKFTLNFGEDIRIFEVLCLKFLLSPPPKFSRSATACIYSSLEI